MNTTTELHILFVAGLLCIGGSGLSALVRSGEEATRSIIAVLVAIFLWLFAFLVHIPR